MSTNNNLHVIFGAGPVGRSVMAELIARGKRVRIINRSGKIPAPAGVEVAAGDAADPAATRALCAGAAVVYDCVNPPYTQWPELFPLLQAGILQGAASAGARLVVMENLYMYGSTGGKPLTEDLPYLARTRKGAVRARMSAALLEAHSRGVVQIAIGRAADFFGPGVIDSALGERIFVPALTGSGRAQMIGRPDLLHSYTYIADVARALVTLGERDEALGQAWHIPSPEPVTMRQILSQIEAQTGCKARLQTAPGWLASLMGLFNPLMREVAEMAYEFEEPFILDSTRFEQAFGLRATPWSEALQATIAWYQQRTRDL